jgi:DNA-directed RNA polymerase subunit RPC12/RpoP
MASKSRKGLGNPPWAVIVPVAHAVIDLATHASCPDCGNRVVLYICVNCRRPVWPERSTGSA